MQTKEKNLIGKDDPKNTMPHQPANESIKINPNAAANENIEEGKREESGDTNGIGTEITDGEDV